MADETPATTTSSATRCGRCQSALGERERIAAGDRVFCRTCYDILKLQVKNGVAAMSEHVRQKTRSPAGTRSLSPSADWQRAHLTVAVVVIRPP